jgi:hypothetical protein
VESFLVGNVLDQPPQWLSQRDAPRVFKVMQDSAHRLGKEKHGTREIEGVIAPAAFAAQAFDDGRRHPALRAKRTRDAFKPGPAVRTGNGPPPLQDSGAAENTQLGKSQVQERVDHGTSPSTQRAELLYFE